MLKIWSLFVKVYTVWIKAVKCRPMINKPPPFKGLDIRIPIIIPIKGREFINEGSALVLKGCEQHFCFETSSTRIRCRLFVIKSSLGFFDG